MSSRQLIDLMRRLRFKNSGLVRNDMRFERRNRPCYYMEDVEAWSTPWDKGLYSYIYEIRDNQPVAPPSGMRSSVPLGGLGAGTVELRADGSFRDWNIFNNSPAGGRKIQLDDAFFGLWTRNPNGSVDAWTLRTHPPRFLPAIGQIEYSGAYPASRLRFTDQRLPFGVELYACGEFHIGQAAQSATPAALFTFILTNPSDRSVETSIMFNLPNEIGGAWSDGTGLILTSPGNGPINGTMAVNAAGMDFVSSRASDNVFVIWEEFAAYGKFSVRKRAKTTNPIDEAVGNTFFTSSPDRFGALAGGVSLAPNETKEIAFVLAWHFPNRSHGHQIVGNYYVNLYSDAAEAAEKVLIRRHATWKAVARWHALCFENSLPEWLQDAMVNSVATIAKTGLWFKDGRWRQWESFSCPVLDPLHIHFYRALPYAWFFPSLRRNTLRAFATAQDSDGRIPENVGGTEIIDKGGGRMMGDAATTFILGVYQDYLWTGAKAFLDELWPNAKRAAQWQIQRCETFGLPNKLDNTYDWWAFVEKDLAAYNAFLHLAAMLAAEKLATAKDDLVFAKICRANLNKARESLVKHLWTGRHYRAWWMADGTHPEAGLHTDTLYGQLWAEIMDLGATDDVDRMRQHLATELKKNDSPFGLKVMQGAGCDDDRHPEVASGFAPGRGGPVNNIIWEGGTLDWCALNIYFGGDVESSLAEAEKIYAKLRDLLRDQWDVRDLSTGWDGHPWCNSHYGRQLILWAIPLALSGQRYSAVDGTLSFAPKVAAPATLPFMTPSACGLLRFEEDGSSSLRVLWGELELRQPVTIRSSGKNVARLHADDPGRTCPRRAEVRESHP